MTRIGDGHSVRRLTAGDEETLRLLMLRACGDGHPIERSVFEARTSAEWTSVLTSLWEKRAIFAVLDLAEEPVATTWCTIGEKRRPLADITWRWFGPDLPASILHMHFDHIAAWACAQGHGALVAASEDDDDRRTLVSAGFEERGLARDGTRVTLERS